MAGAPMSGVNLTSRLAEHAIGLRFEAIPGDVLRIAGHAFLDWYSLALASYGDPTVTALAEHVCVGGLVPQATLIGRGVRVRASDAAMVNGTAGHLLDFDDAHLPSRVHPSVPLWPAVLGLSEWRAMSGKDLMLAYVAGVEVQSRLSRALGSGHYRLGWHSTATLGSFGATAACARLSGLDVQQCRHAFGLNASWAGGLRAQFGTSCKPLHAGHAAANGLLAAALAARGLAGQPDIFDRPDGYAALTTDTFQPEAAFAAPDHWEVRDIVFKYHASCYGTQAPIEAALRATAQRGSIGDFGRIEQIDVVVETQYLSVCNIAEPRTGPESKFSLRHAVALALAGWDTLAEESFSPAACADPVLRALRAKVRVTGDDAMPRANARLRLFWSDGVECDARVDASQAERNLARQEGRLRAKAARLLAPRLGNHRAQALIDHLLAIGAAPSVAQWHADVDRLLA